MPENAPDAQQLQTVIDSLPTTGIIIAIVVCGLGALLWLVGGRLARPACGVCGLAIGGFLGFAVAQMLAEEGAYTLPLVIGGALAGGLIAGLLFRLWVATIGAVVLALIVPAAVLIWQGEVQITPDSGEPQNTSSPEEIASTEAEQPAQGLTSGEFDFFDLDIFRGDTQAERGSEGSDNAEPRGRDRGGAADRDAPAGANESAAEAEAEASGLYSRGMATLRRIYREQIDNLRQHWEQLDGSSKSVVYIGGLIGAVAGLALGLIMPNAAAGLQTALVGTVMMLIAGRELVRTYAPDQMGWLPQTPRAMLLVIGLITIIGAALQWTVFFRRTDK